MRLKASAADIGFGGNAAFAQSLSKNKRLTRCALSERRDIDITACRKIGNKVLLKEKVTIYRFTEGAPKAETASETDSTTEEIRTADTQEEEE